jgi:GNAT superfamily N-acetyltransferase
LRVHAGDEIRIERFYPDMQGAFRTLVLDGMAERWGAVDDSLNTDLDDIDTHYDRDCVLMALDGSTVIGTGILLVRATEGEIVRMSVHRDYRRRGIATQVLAELVNLATSYPVKRIVVETNARWIEARNLYEAFGFKFTAWSGTVQKIRGFVREGEILTAVKWAGSTHGAELISQIWTSLDPAVLAPALAEVWMMSHGPLAQLGART